MIDFVSAHPNYAYSEIFLVALSEAIPVVGTVVPGSTLVIAISALAAGASANPWPKLFRCDSLRYFIGGCVCRETGTQTQYLPRQPPQPHIVQVLFRM